MIIRWLDEVISGKLLAEESGWFGYHIAGSPDQLLQRYYNAENIDYKTECLIAFLHHNELSTDMLNIIEQEYLKTDASLQKIILQILTKFDYTRAKPYLLAYLDIDQTNVFKYLYWYAKNYLSEWSKILTNIAPTINDDEAFRLFTYLLEASDIDYLPIILPFTKHPNKNIRVTAFYNLGKHKDKATIIDTFIAGLSDPENHVIHITLQALDGVTDRRLLQSYQDIAKKFPQEQDYILCNLNHRLKEFKLTNKTILEIDPNTYQPPQDKKWYQFWK